MLATILWILRGGPFRIQKGTFSCGHEGTLQGEYRVDDHSFSWKLHPIIAARQPCVTCSVEASIRCGFCESRIYPGNRVALYGKDSAGINWEIATEISDQVVGCLRRDCCPTAAFYAGAWTVDGLKSYQDEQKTAA